MKLSRFRCETQNWIQMCAHLCAKCFRRVFLFFVTSIWRTVSVAFANLKKKKKNDIRYANIRHSQRKLAVYNTRVCGCMCVCVCLCITKESLFYSVILFLFPKLLGVLLCSTHLSRTADVASYFWKNFNTKLTKDFDLNFLFLRKHEKWNGKMNELYTSIFRLVIGVVLWKQMKTVRDIPIGYTAIVGTQRMHNEFAYTMYYV